MDSSDKDSIPAGRSPRRELLGPRPTPLKVRKDSHKIVKKPPLAPPPPPTRHHDYHQQQQQESQPRAPVIIYTVSPRVIHTNPNDFMDLVQRLTGRPSSSISSSSASSSSLQQRDHIMVADDQLSPAARYASIEKTKSPEKKNKQGQSSNFEDENRMTMMGFTEDVDRSNLFPGILSPGPTSLPTISPNFFLSQPSDPNSGNFFHAFSPVIHSNRNYIEGSFMPSPNSSYPFPQITSPSGFVYPQTTSPTPPFDIFNNDF